MTDARSIRIDIERTIASSTVSATAAVAIRNSVLLQQVFVPVLQFCGLETHGSEPRSRMEVNELDRLEALRLAFRRFGAEAAEPHWSSRLLTELWQLPGMIPGGCAEDLVKALILVYHDQRPGLTATSAAFVHDFSRAGLAFCRSNSQVFETAFLFESDNSGPLEAYLRSKIALFRPALIVPEKLGTFLAALRGTKQRNEILESLQPELAQHGFRFRLEGTMNSEP